MAARKTTSANNLNQYIIPLAFAGTIYYIGNSILKKIGVVDDEKDKQNADLFSQGGAFDPKMYKTVSGASLLTVGGADYYIKILLDAKRIFDDDEPAIYAVFQAMKSKTQISFLSDRFALTVGESLIFYLRHVLSDSELNNIYNIVQPLPLK